MLQPNEALVLSGVLLLSRIRKRAIVNICGGAALGDRPQGVAVTCFYD